MPGSAKAGLGYTLFLFVFRNERQNIATRMQLLLRLVIVIEVSVYVDAGTAVARYVSQVCLVGRQKIKAGGRVRHQLLHLTFTER